MSITVKLEAFEGPLDLLLHLIEKNKVDIYDIPIAIITDQYMEYVMRMQTEDMDVASEFLVMAATLLDIKARMLLPAETDENGEEEDPRAELVARLIAYKMMKANTQMLRDCGEEASQVAYRPEDIPAEVASYIPPPDIDALFAGVTAEALTEAFKTALRRVEENVDPVRHGFGRIEKETFKIYDKSRVILGMARSRGKFMFRELLNSSTGKVEMVVTFLAVLELVKMGRLAVTQEEIGGDIGLEAIDTGEMSEDELKALTENADE
ncbi:MAG: segregation/condensation protein A [Lachnospiraceae bacterium]|nr:segregation/condensation protein A [Lachnospiraceae bacterium]